MSSPVPAVTTTPAEIVAFVSQDTAYQAIDSLERTNAVMQEGANNFEKYREKAENALKEQDELIEYLQGYKRNFYIASGVAVTTSIVAIGLFLSKCPQ